MKNLIVGRFSTYDEGEAAARALQHAGFPPGDMSLFFVNPQGQHDIHPLGGDEDESTGTHAAGGRAAGGAAGGAGVGGLVGLAALPVTGPAGPLVGAAVGAYTGSLVGALGGMKKGAGETADAGITAPATVRPPAGEAPDGMADGEPIGQKAGVMLAVAAATAEQRGNAASILGDMHADEVIHTEGDLREGDWMDFDPRSQPKPVE